jgi:hypothetical protein
VKSQAKNLIIAVATAAVLAGAFLAGFDHAGSIRSALGVQSAKGAQPSRAMGRADVEPPLNTTAAVIASLEAAVPSFRSDAGMTAADIAATRPIFTFDSSLASFAAGLSVFETPLANGGYCLTFAHPTACTRVAPSMQEPLIGLGYDPDAERAGQPFVIVSIRQPEVQSVSYLCAGESYPAQISGDVVWLIGPSPSRSLEDCSEQVTFNDGHTVTKHV